MTIFSLWLPIIVSAEAGRSGLTINLSADRLDRVDPLATREDRQVFMSVSYQFGEPPPDR